MTGTARSILHLFAPMKFEPQHLRGDIFGGLTIGIVALPLALAFGVASGLPEGPKAGLYGAIILGYIAAIFGGTKPQVSGPTGPMTVVAAGFVATADEPRYIFIAVLLGGLLQVLFGTLKLGHYIRYVPRPVISGFMTGIGLIIITTQIQPLLGAPSTRGPIEAIAGAADALSNLNVHALLLGIGTTATVYLVPRLQKQVPAPLVALLLATAISEWQGLNVPKIGTLPTGLPEFSLFLPSASAVPEIFFAALSLAILGSLDTLLGSVVVDQVTNTRHDSDKELVGQGLGNMTSGIFGGLPGAGATMRTLLNVRTGGKTGLSGVIHSTLLTGILLGLGKYAALIPLPVLGGILVTVGVGIIDYPALRSLRQLPGADRLVFFVVLGLTLFVDLITAVQMGFLIATLLFFKNLSQRELTRSGPLTPMIVQDEPAAVSLANRIQVIQADGPIVFGTSEAFVNAFEEAGPEVEAIVIRMPRVPLIDQTGAHALQEFVLRMRRQGTTVVLSGLPAEPTNVLRKLGVIPAIIPEDAVFPTLAEAVQGLNAKLESKSQLLPQPYLPKVGG